MVERFQTAFPSLMKGAFSVGVVILVFQYWGFALGPFAFFLVALLYLLEIGHEFLNKIPIGAAKLGAFSQVLLSGIARVFGIEVSWFLELFIFVGVYAFFFVFIFVYSVIYRLKTKQIKSDKKEKKR